MSEPTEPTYWELFKSLLDDIKSRRALEEHGGHLDIRIAQDKRELVKYFLKRKYTANKARLEHDLDELVWGLQDDDRMWDWMTRRGGHFDYIRNDRLVETPREIYRAYCKRFGIEIPLPGQQTLF